jgi:DNA polymerase I-like protein with 3'-5' exonuclease and polymerase domains
MLVSIEREGRNHPIQGTNADIAKLVMGSGCWARWDDRDWEKRLEMDETRQYLWHILEPKYGAFLCNMVHDELGVEVKEDIAPECEMELVALMELAGGDGTRPAL